MCGAVDRCPCASCAYGCRQGRLQVNQTPLAPSALDIAPHLFILGFANFAPRVALLEDV